MLVKERFTVQMYEFGATKRHYVSLNLIVIVLDCRSPIPDFINLNLVDALELSIIRIEMY